MPINRLMDKKDELYTHNGRSFSCEKGGHLATCNNMHALYDIIQWNMYVNKYHICGI